MSVNKVDKTTGDLIQIAGRGRAEYGASTVRTGMAKLPATSAGAWNTFEVNFDTPMPDADYEVSMDNTNLQYVHLQAVRSKTAGGFTGILYTRDGIADDDSTYVKYKAFKLYTDTEYNAVLTSGSCAHGNSEPFLNNQSILAYLRSLDGNTKFATFTVDPASTAVTDKVDSTTWYSYSCFRQNTSWMLTAMSYQGVQYISSITPSTTQLEWTRLCNYNDRYSVAEAFDADFNNLTASGRYFASNNISHMPVAGYAYFVDVLAHGSDSGLTVKQVAYMVGSNHTTTYIRNYWAGTWSNWKQIVGDPS